MLKRPYISLKMCSRASKYENNSQKIMACESLQVSNLTINYMKVLTSNNILWILCTSYNVVVPEIFPNLNVVAHLQQAGVLSCQGFFLKILTNCFVRCCHTVHLFFMQDIIVLPFGTIFISTFSYGKGSYLKFKAEEKVICEVWKILIIGTKQGRFPSMSVDELAGLGGCEQ